MKVHSSMENFTHYNRQSRNKKNYATGMIVRAKTVTAALEEKKLLSN
jgi:hypothetical protein